MKKYQVIRLVAFPYDILVASNVSISAVKKYLSGHFDIKLSDEAVEMLSNSGLGHTLRLPNKATLIYFPNTPDTGLIAHEVYHAVYLILQTMGITPSDDSDEVYAYLIEYVMRQIRKD